MQSDDKKLKTRLNIREIAIYTDAFCFYRKNGTNMKYRIKSVDFITNEVEIAKDGETERVHPAKIILILIHTDSVHPHIQSIAESIEEIGGQQAAMLYLIKKKVDVFGFIDAGLAVKAISTKDVNAVDQDN